MIRVAAPAWIAFAVLVATTHAASAQNAGEVAVPRVTVTGSRIQTETEAEAALVVVTREELNRAGADSLGAILQTLPHNTGAPANTNVNNSGDGSVRIGLRGLGPQRTLVLLNGRRLPNSGVGADSSVDLNSIPLSMVERVEVLTMGRSAVYGAEAIGGVVNVITRSAFTGIETGAQLSRSVRGDGDIARAQALVGGELTAGNWMLGADYVHQRGVSMADRAYSAQPITFASTDGERVPAGSPAIANGRFIIGPENALGLDPGRYTRVPGGSGRSAEDWRPVRADDVFNYAPYNLLQTPNERGSLWLAGTLSPREGVELFGEGLLSRRESAQRLAPAPYMLPLNAAPELPDGTRYIPASNYYNPFGTDVFVGTRRLAELDERGYSEHVTLWRALVGARGRIGEWNWEGTVSTAQSSAVTRESGLPIAERFIAGLGPSGPDSTGKIVCGTPDAATGIVPQAAVIAGCVPINLFGGAGTITPDQLAYMTSALRDHGTNAQRIATLQFEGPWGRLPTGPIDWAFGTELRRESGAYRYDPQREGGAVGEGLVADIPGGSFKAWEGYAEMRAPMIREDSKLGQLDAALGARLSDFDVFGTRTTWHAGLHWASSASWSMHVDYSSVFRAPAIDELYQSQVVTASLSPPDPCGDSPTPEQQRHCAANGVPGGRYTQIEDDVSLMHQGGNTALGPEQGYSFAAGIAFRSTGRLAWHASADYFHTRLDDFIEQGDPEAIANECANHGTPLACAKIERFHDGSLRLIDIRRSNLGRVTVQGADFAGSVDLPTRAGRFSVQALVSALGRYDAQVFEGSETLPKAGRGNGGLILPKWRALGGATWTRDGWSARYTLQWIGSYTDCSTTLDNTLYCDAVPSVTYHDVEASYSWPALQVHAGISNLTDREPPYLNAIGNTSPATYRLLGRLYFFRIGYSPGR